MVRSGPETLEFRTKKNKKEKREDAVVRRDKGRKVTSEVDS